MSPQDAAWERYHALGLSTDKPIKLMDAVLDAYAQHHALREAVRAFVRAEPESAAKVLTFGEMVRALEATCT